jgi:hypothetical protein
MASRPRKPTTRKASADDAAGKRVALTLRLSPDDWLRLKMLALEMTRARGRMITAHELVHGAVLGMLDEGVEGFVEDDDE